MLIAETKRKKGKIRWEANVTFEFYPQPQI